MGICVIRKLNERCRLTLRQKTHNYALKHGLTYLNRGVSATSRVQAFLLINGPATVYVRLGYGYDFAVFLL